MLDAAMIREHASVDERYAYLVRDHEEFERFAPVKLSVLKIAIAYGKNLL